jgi:hypothetical protein
MPIGCSKKQKPVNTIIAMPLLPTKTITKKGLVEWLNVL